MRGYLTYFAVALVGLAFPAAASAEDASPSRLVGTWKLVSAKYGGQQSALPKDFTTVKHMTPTHFMWATYDEAGKVIRTGGGSYTFDGKVLEDTPAYGMGPDFDVVNGRRQTFECKVEGRRMYQSGTLSNGMSLEEVWELVGKR